MRISVICVGKIKEKFYRDAVDEYVRRLGGYCRVDIVEVADEKTFENLSLASLDQITEKEARRILPKLRDDMFVCTLEITGKRYTSEQFAAMIENAALSGKSHIAFVIGGSLGLHPSVKKRSDLAVSFSDMTFPHQLMRVILCEQIYRAYRIISGQPYHK